MADEPTDRPTSGHRELGGPSVGPPPGLCGACRYSRTIRTDRGTTFRRCERSSMDVRFLRYPVLPVVACPGFEAGDLA